MLLECQVHGFFLGVGVPLTALISLGSPPLRPSLLWFVYFSRISILDEFENLVFTLSLLNSSKKFTFSKKIH
jgi:hypothetical protein